MNTFLVACLSVFAVLIAMLGVALSVADATVGPSLVGFGCLLAVLARIVQAAPTTAGDRNARDEAIRRRQLAEVKVTER
jgi:hypothetical protein